MSEVFKKVKDSNDKEAGQMFTSKILPLYAHFSEFAICLNLILRVGFHQSSTTGSLRLSQSLQRGLQVGWRMEEQPQSCRWSGSF
jgi:hypothetical protein